MLRRGKLAAALLSMTALVAYAGPAQQEEWRDKSEKSISDAHEHELFVQKCGHDIKVMLDWDSFKFDKWQSIRGNNVGATCMQEILSDIGYFCGSSSSEDQAYKKAAKKLASLTCHYRPCAKLPGVTPDVKNPATNPGVEYSVTKDGKSLDKYFCEDSTISTAYDARWWLKKIL